MRVLFVGPFFRGDGEVEVFGVIGSFFLLQVFVEGLHDEAISVPLPVEEFAVDYPVCIGVFEVRVATEYSFGCSDDDAFGD